MPLFRRPTAPVSRKARRRPGEILALVVAVLCVTAPVILALWQRGELLRYGYEIEDLKSERARLDELKRKLLVERAHLESLGVVEKAARNDLGLVDPADEQIFVVAQEEVR